MNGLEMKYFVLKPKGKNIYAQASRAAMYRYAEIISDENPILARELREWAEREYRDSPTHQRKGDGQFEREKE